MERFTNEDNYDKFIEYNEVKNPSYNIYDRNEVLIFINDYLKKDNISKNQLRNKRNIDKRKEIIIEIEK